MNYLWEILLQARKQGIEKERLRFKLPQRYSPYQELSEQYINVTRLEEPYEIEVNPYYRFLSLFKAMFHPDLGEFRDLRNGLFHLLMHQLGENDVKMGMTREEYYKKLLQRDFGERGYGSEAKRIFEGFTWSQKEMILEGLLCLYRTGDNLSLFKRILCNLMTKCIVYNSQEDPHELLIYIGHRETEEMKKKVNLVLYLFLGLQYKAEIYYEYHFGIIDVEETMSIDEIAIC